MDLIELQNKIKEADVDGWLFYDINGRDDIAYRILDLSTRIHYTRRWFYFVPAEGTPVKIISSIEKDKLSSLVGTQVLYRTWEELHVAIEQTLKKCKRLLMQYSRFNMIPSISLVDAGTIELIKSFQIEVISSAGIIQYFTTRLDNEEIEMFKLAGKKIHAIKDSAYDFIFDSVKHGKNITEYDVQKHILNKMDDENITCNNQLPIVAVDEHSADPHFDLSFDNTKSIRNNQRILIDLFGKINCEKGIYYDITWCGFTGKDPDEEYMKVFNITASAREYTKKYIQAQIDSGIDVAGWQADKVCRDFISSKGYQDYFIHRTGHSIYKDVHDRGANLDNYETREERNLIQGSCFSIEPGIYINKIGVRSEISVLFDYDNQLKVFGPEQTNLLLLE